MNPKEEVLAVKKLGDEIGYGNLMNIASALWRDMLKKTGTPIEGAFVPTCIPFIKKGYHDPKSTENYDCIIKEHFKS